MPEDERDGQDTIIRVKQGDEIYARVKQVLDCLGKNDRSNSGVVELVSRDNRAQTKTITIAEIGKRTWASSHGSSLWQYNCLEVKDEQQEDNNQQQDDDAFHVKRNAKAVPIVLRIRLSLRRDETLAARPGWAEQQIKSTLQESLSQKGQKK